MAENRPPRDIDAARFFTEWLPREFATEFGPGKRRATDITVAVHLEGDGGGQWILDVRDGQLATRSPDAPGPTPLVTMRQPVDDWRALAVGESGPIDLAPAHASPLDVLFVDPSSRQIMSSVKGTIRFEVTGYNGRTWWMVVKFGPQPEAVQPDATISVDAETYSKMLARKMAPPEAYFSGKIKLAGDTALAMQLGMAMLPRFTQSG
jgi:SCP-2 sterol transfer family